MPYNVVVEERRVLNRTNKKAPQNFYSAFHNKAAYLQPEASGFFYRYITEHGDVSKGGCFFDSPAPSTVSA